MGECEYCKGYKEILDDRKLSRKKDVYVGTKIWAQDNELRVFACADVYEPAIVEASVKINFCPMCGRNLTANI